jgi:hypothetical protein
MARVPSKDNAPSRPPSNSGRALWTFLFYTLAGPFIAGLAAAAAAMAGLTDGLSAEPRSPGEIAMSIYLWSAVPAAFTALIVLPFLWRRGTFGWPEAGIAGVVGFGLGFVLAPLPLGSATVYVAFLAGLISIVVRQILLVGNVISR